MMLLWQVLLAMGATAGFAVLFNAPQRVLLVCAVIGGAALFVRSVLAAIGLSLDVATLVGAVVVGLLAEWGARRYRVPALVFTLSGFIPFIPGVLAYQTVLQFLDGNYVDGLASGVQAVVRAGAIAGGIGTVTAVVRLRAQSAQPARTH